MDRTYGDYKQSEQYRIVRNESVKVLQLFEVDTCDAAVQARRWLYLGHVLHRRPSAAEHVDIPHFQGIL